MNAWLAWLRFDWPWIAALALAFGAGAAFNSALSKQGRLRKFRYHPRSRSRKVNVDSDPPRLQLGGFDPAAQLRIVEQAAFVRRRLLNRGEERLWRLVEQTCTAEATGWRVMAQVSLGEVLASKDGGAYRAINSKRVDLLIVGDDGYPRHAIELQGSGHHLGPAATRDAVKKEALRRAGIGYHEIVSGDTPAEVKALIAKLVRPERDRGVPRVHTTG